MSNLQKAELAPIAEAELNLILEVLNEVYVFNDHQKTLENAKELVNDHSGLYGSLGISFLKGMLVEHEENYNFMSNVVSTINECNRLLYPIPASNV